jgi:threonine aldolase
VLPIREVERTCAWAHERGLATHLDGARLFNAVVASGIAASEWARHFDTVSVCFSKGLGAPVGSALCGPRALMHEALRHRKLFGGGMRQAGLLAAAALYALEHHVDRLADDHAHAATIADCIGGIDGLKLQANPVQTNILFFSVHPRLGTAGEFCARLKKYDVLMMVENARTIRAVTHLDVGREQIETVCNALRQVAAGGSGDGRVETMKSAYA